MKILKNLNGLQIVGIGFMLASIVWNIINAATGAENTVFAMVLLPVGITIWLIGLQRAKSNDTNG
ncbi:MAG: hypothetical protein AAGD96_04655 [Chloroflexota bacterium]